MRSPEYGRSTSIGPSIIRSTKLRADIGLAWCVLKYRATSIDTAVSGYFTGSPKVSRPSKVLYSLVTLITGVARALMASSVVANIPSEQFSVRYLRSFSFPAY